MKKNCILVYLSLINQTELTFTSYENKNYKKAPP